MLTSTYTAHYAIVPQLPVEIWDRILHYYAPSKEDYAVNLPWKRSAKKSTLASLSQVCSSMRQLALPLIWAIVYVETMKDWGLLWKRICLESGQYIHTFINFWAIAKLPHLCMDYLQEQGKDLLWYAFIDRKNNPLCNRTFDLEENPYESLGNGPDGHGPDAIIHSREVFLQACKEISSTWTKRLSTIYWDATTTFPEEVILSIRDIQESVDDVKSSFPGLEHLWIDYIERTSEEGDSHRVSYQMSSTFTHARKKAIFREPIWKLGSTTLKKLKMFSLAPPFWSRECQKATMMLDLNSLPPNHLRWGVVEADHGRLQKQLKDYSEDTGPGQFYRTIQYIQPEVFFSSSQSPFHSKDLLPCWARIRCIHIFNMVTLTNCDIMRNYRLPPWAEVFQTQKNPSFEDWYVRPQHAIWSDSEAGRYLRGAIQLRPTLELLSKRKGGLPLTGQDITSYAISPKEVEGSAIEWKEDWNYARICPEGFIYDGAFIDECQNYFKEAEDLSSVYKEWLQDPQLADQVAQAYNQGVKEHSKAAYPFCHSDYPGQVYFETSQCTSQDGKIWLDRPRHRGCYSNINVEFKKKSHFHQKKGQKRIKRTLKMPHTYSPYDKRTLHPYLRYIRAYRPSL